MKGAYHVLTTTRFNHTVFSFIILIYLVRITVKKILGLLLLSSSLFSMELALVSGVQDHISKEHRLYNSSHYLQKKLYKKDYLNEHDLHKVSADVFAPEKLGSVKLYHGEKGFYVNHDNKIQRIQKCFTEPAFRNATKEQLEEFGKAGYFSINKMNDGEFSLKAKGRVIGGGAGGAVAGFYIGRFAVHFIAHGAIGIISLCTGPAAFATGAALEACLLPHIIAAAEVGALAGGIVGAVATGPV